MKRKLLYSPGSVLPPLSAFLRFTIIGICRLLRRNSEIDIVLQENIEVTVKYRKGIKNRHFEKHEMTIFLMCIAFKPVSLRYNIIKVLAE